MKTAVVVFRSPLQAFDGKYLQKVVGSLGDIKVDTVEVLSDDDDVGFATRYDFFRDTVDNLVIFTPYTLRFDIKGIISKKADSPLVFNDNAVNIVKGSGETPNFEGAENFAKLPIDATLIPNTAGYLQGFMLEEQQFTVVVLPSVENEFENMCKGFVEPYFSTKYGKEKECKIIKYLGLLEDARRNIVAVQNQFDKAFEFFIEESFRDCKIKLLFNKNTDRQTEDLITREICVRLNDGIYAREDMSLAQTLLMLLKMGNKKIATAESFTSGRIVGELLKISGASAVVYEGIVAYSNESKEERLGVNPQDFREVGAVSSKVAYSMACGLLQNEKVDIAVSSTGIAGPKSDDTLKPVGLCFIGVGSKERVDIYKYNLNGNREEITETAKNIALFLSIKKLKNV